MVRYSNNVGSFPRSVSAFSSDDVDGISVRPMCGPHVMTKLLSSKRIKSPSNATSPRRMFSEDSQGRRIICKKQEYTAMAFDLSPIDPLFASDSNLFSAANHINQSGASSHTSSTIQGGNCESTIFVPQFDVQKAKQHKIRTKTAVSKENRDGLSDHSSRSTVSSKETDERSARSGQSSSQKEQHLERMLVSMRELVVQQQRNITTLDAQNTQYRDKLATCQDHVLSLKKAQLDQKDEILKLKFERESFEAEAMWLREELLTIRSELSIVKKNHFAALVGVESQQSKEASSEIRWAREQQFILNRPSQDSTERAARDNQTTSETNTTKRSHFANLAAVEAQQNRDEGSDASSEVHWARDQVEALTRPSQDAPERPASVNHQANSNQKHNSPGKCSDIQELQRRATELRATVARMHLCEEPEGREPNAEDMRDDISSISGHMGFDGQSDVDGYERELIGTKNGGRIGMDRHQAYTHYQLKGRESDVRLMGMASI